MLAPDASAAVELPNTSQCPRCGAGLRCAMVRRDGPPQASTAPEGGTLRYLRANGKGVKSVGANMPAGDASCWCFSMPRVVPVPASDRGETTGCLCPACLQQLIDSHDLRPAAD